MRKPNDPKKDCDGLDPELSETTSKRIDIEKIANARSALLEFSYGSPIKDILIKILDNMESLTSSSVAFFYIPDDEHKKILFRVYSTGTYHKYTNLHNATDQAGIWDESLHIKVPVVENNVSKSKNVKRVSEGHVQLERQMLIPVLRKGRVAAIAVIGNKACDYNEEDIKIASFFVDISWDIAERKIREDDMKLLENKLLNSRKMESMARFAGNIAHDFNNMLTPVFTYGEILKNKIKEDAQKKIVINMMASAQRCRELSKQLMFFAGKHTFKAVPADINHTVEGFMDILKNSIGENIQLIIETDAENGICVIDRAQIEQMLLNLAINASDAIDNKGKLTIRTRNEILNSEKLTRYDTITPGRYIVLDVTDTGKGIEEGIMDRLFEPFFTTKADGKSTGLGLPIVHGIAQKHNAFIDISSKPGKGTSISVYFPESIEKSVEDAPAEDETLADLSGDETILVVDDEEIVKKSVCDMLKNEGYNTMHASGFEEAISVSAKHKGIIHLLLTDFMMPNRNGMELYNEMKKQRSSLKILFMSGYAMKKIAGTGIFIKQDDFIPKPFSREELLTKIRRKIDKS